MGTTYEIRTLDKSKDHLIVCVASDKEYLVARRPDSRSAQLLVEELETLDLVTDFLRKKNLDLEVLNKLKITSCEVLQAAYAETHGHDIKYLIAKLERLKGALTAPEINDGGILHPLLPAEVQEHAIRHDLGIGYRIKKTASFNTIPEQDSWWRRLLVRLKRAWLLLRTF